MKQTNERLCALAQKGDAAALDSLIDNNKSFIGKVANDLFRSMNLAQAGLNLDTDDLKQAGNLGLWKAVPKFDAARGMKFLGGGRLLRILLLLSLPFCGSQKIPQQFILHSQSLDLVCLLRDNISGLRIFSWPSFRPWRDSGFHLCLFVVIPVDPILDL